MERKTTNPLSKLAMLVLALALLLQLVPALRHDEAAAANNPCSSLPKTCRYTWNPVTQCCEPGVRDCIPACL